MSNFSFTETAIKGVYLVDVKCFGDKRGFFMESYNQAAFEEAGLAYRFVQDNQSCSVKGVLRGLHFQKNYPQAKLIRVLRGEIFDVAVDLRRGSETYGRWIGEFLSEENRRQLLIPRGFAHGFLVLSDCAEIAYKCDDFYHPEDEGGVMYNDPVLNIVWPDAGELILSEKDTRYPPLSGSGLVF